MPGQTILALVSAPFYGLLAALIVLPVTVAGGLMVIVASYFAYFLLAVPIVLIFMIFLAVLVLSGRLAAAFAGLKPLRTQGDLLAAMARSTFPALMGFIFVVLLAGCGFLLYAEIDGARELWWYSATELEAAAAKAIKDPQAADAIFALENLNLGPVVQIIQGALMIVVTGLAIFLLPRSVALRNWYDDAYSTGLLALRFFIALPFFAAVTLMLGHILGAGIEALVTLTAGEKVLLLFARSFVELSLFAGIVLSFEAIEVRMAAEDAEAIQEVIRELQVPDSERHRALREARSEHS